MPPKRPSGTSDGKTDPPLSEARTTETEVVLRAQSAVANRPILTLLTGLNAGQVFAIERTQTVIGRAREAWVYIDAAGISRQHARIIMTSSTSFLIEDLGSTNGVF